MAQATLKVNASKRNGLRSQIREANGDVYVGEWRDDFKEGCSNIYENYSFFLPFFLIR